MLLTYLTHPAYPFHSLCCLGPLLVFLNPLASPRQYHIAPAPPRTRLGLERSEPRTQGEPFPRRLLLEGTPDLAKNLHERLSYHSGWIACYYRVHVAHECRGFERTGLI
jgi:hypothetical protein